VASNFTIRYQRNNGNLYINLKGDFDGSSAQVLFDAVKRNCEDDQKIFIDTSGLRRVHPFGRDVLKSNLSSLKGKTARVIFTGENSEVLAPESY